MNQENKMTKCHSDTADNFIKWLEGWDSRISTLDDFESQEISNNKYKFCIYVIDKLLSDSDDKVMSKYMTNEDKTKALIINQKKKFYVDLQKVRNIMLTEMYKIANLYELKNRKTNEIFKLCAEISKLKNG